MAKFSEFYSIFTFFLILFPLSGVCGLKVSLERRGPIGAKIDSLSGENLGNVLDVRYVANITLNGKRVPVSIDTGSTDLWVEAASNIGTFNDTNIPIHLGYGDGSYGVDGTIGLAPFEFGAYKVPSQAFVHVTNSTMDSEVPWGIYGLLGLGFDFASASRIKAAVRQSYGNSATWANSVLSNIFNQNPSQPNIIAMRLSRSDDLEDTKGGLLTIGEYDPDYANITQSPQLAQYPVGGDRWTTLLEGLYTDGKSIPVTSKISSLPPGYAQALLDTGTPTTLFPTPMWEAIYSSIPGAVKGHLDGEPHWFVPCNTTTVIELAFGGVRYPIHPLDLTNITHYFLDGRRVLSCISAMQVLPDDWIRPGVYEILLGDTFLRNVYAAYNFGDASSSSKPYMQLLSITDPAKAISQVSTIRQRTMAGIPEVPPAEAAKLTGKLPTTSTGAAVPEKLAVSGDLKGAAVLADGGNLYDGISAAEIKKYGIIALCLLGASVFIGLVSLVIVLVYFVRKRPARSDRRFRPLGFVKESYVPVKVEAEPTAYSGYSDRDTGY